MTTLTLSNPKLYLPSPLKHLFGCHFENPWKNQNIIVTFQSGQRLKCKKLTDDGRQVMAKAHFAFGKVS
jgi:hypothetical protein